MRFIIVVAFIAVLHAALSSTSCPPLPSHMPANITDLTPANIKVVMALGDSITAAFGLEGASGLLDEFRGQSWSIGGDAGALTIPNLIREFNPNVTGASIGQHLVELCYGPLCPPFQYHPTMDVFNAAQSGAMVTDLLNHELDYLIAQLNANPNISMQNDYKLLTILIGANDLCISCTGAKNYLSPTDFDANLRGVLEKVRMSIPRVFVNLVPLFNLSGVYYLSLQKPECAEFHRLFFVECECIFSDDANKTRSLIDQYCTQYAQVMEQIASDYRTLNYPDFAAVIQPFMLGTQIVNLPIEFLSTLDCFHPSALAHAAMATALWNNMLQPLAQKTSVMNVTQTPNCPTTDSRLFVF